MGIMKTIERKRYHQPVIRVIKINPIQVIAGTTIDSDSGNTGGGGSTGNNNSRGFFFEDEE
jgi:hypothetical protein